MLGHRSALASHRTAAVERCADCTRTICTRVWTITGEALALFCCAVAYGMLSSCPRACTRRLCALWCRIGSCRGEKLQHTTRVIPHTCTYVQAACASHRCSVSAALPRATPRRRTSMCAAGKRGVAVRLRADRGGRADIGPALDASSSSSTACTCDQSVDSACAYCKTDGRVLGQGFHIASLT
jgi:hypothetical protein